MQKFRKLLAVLVCAAMTLTAAPCLTVGAADGATEGQCGDGVYWKLDADGTLTISGSGAVTSTPWRRHGLESLDDVVKKVVVEDGVTKIDANWCFMDFPNITEAFLAGSLENVGYRMFESCTSIENVTLGQGIKTISDMAFHLCSNLESITIPNSVTEIGERAFSNSGLKNIEIPDSVVNIGNRVFNSCAELISATLPNNWTTIPDNTFSLCYQLENINLPENLEKIGKNAFQHCRALPQINISEKLTEIGVGAFSGCNAMTDFKVDQRNKTYSDIDGILFNYDKTTLMQYPAGKTQIEYKIPDGTKTIDNGAFSGGKLEKIIVPASVESFSVASMYSLKEIDAAADNPNYTSDGGILFNKDKSVLLQYPAAKEGAEYATPEGVTAVGEKAFYQNRNLTELTVSDGVKTLDKFSVNFMNNLKKINLPNSLESIGEGAFSNSSMEEIELPEGVSDIDFSAFEGCLNLRSVVLPESLKNIGDCAFYGCTALENVKLPKSMKAISNQMFEGCTALKNIHIPENMTEIGAYAFQDCSSLEKIIIPKSVESLYNDTFTRCASLKSILFMNPEISVPFDAITDCPDVTLYGFTGSSVERYADDYGIPFVAIDGLTPSISEVKAKAEGGTVTVTVEAAEISPFQSVMAVAFGAGGAVVDSAEVEGGSAALNGENVKTVKVFCWDSLESMRPLCEAKEAEVTQ